MREESDWVLKNGGELGSEEEERKRGKEVREGEEEGEERGRSKKGEGLSTQVTERDRKMGLKEEKKGEEKGNLETKKRERWD